MSHCSISDPMESLSLHTAADAIDYFDSQTLKSLEQLVEQRDDLVSRVQWLKELAHSVEEVAVHPRVASRIKLSRFVEIDSLLNTAEFRLKYAEFSVVSSLKMTSSYVEKSIEEMNQIIQALNEQIEKVHEQRDLQASISTGKPVEVVRSDNSIVTIYEHGLVDIVESASEPYVSPARVARFKTNAERDSFLAQGRDQHGHKKKGRREDILRFTTGDLRVPVCSSAKFSTSESPRETIINDLLVKEQALRKRLSEVFESIRYLASDADAYNEALDRYVAAEFDTSVEVPYACESAGAFQDYLQHKQQNHERIVDVQDFLGMVIVELANLHENLLLLNAVVVEFRHHNNELGALYDERLQRLLGSQRHDNDDKELRDDRDEVLMKSCSEEGASGDRLTQQDRREHHRHVRQMLVDLINRL